MKTRELARRSASFPAAYWITGLLLVAGVTLYGVPERANSQDVVYEIFSDSEIRLEEISEEGFYYSRSISMLCREGEVRIAQVIDDREYDGVLAFDSYNGLWQQAIGLGLPGIADAPVENAYPGQSDFDYHFRDGDLHHPFSAYAVDYLTDTRYRQLARAIIATADRVFSDDPPPPPPQ